jgi:hypothetical protein
MPLPEHIDRERFLVFDGHWNPRLTGSVPATRWTPARILPPPFRTYLLEKRAHQRLAQSLRGWFAERGLAGYTGRLFGRGSVAIAAFCAGPVGAGALLLWNFARTGWVLRAMLTLVVTGLLAIGYAQLAAGTLTDAQVDPEGAVLGDAQRFLFAALVFVTVDWVMPRAIRRHLQVGGPTMPGWATTLVITGLTIGWITLQP